MKIFKKIILVLLIITFMKTNVFAEVCNNDKLYVTSVSKYDQTGSITQVNEPSINNGDFINLDLKCLK